MLIMIIYHMHIFVAIQNVPMILRKHWISQECILLICAINVLRENRFKGMEEWEFVIVWVVEL